MRTVHHVHLVTLACLIAACSNTGDRCASDEDCALGSYCLSGDCASDCVLDIECPEGFRCTVRGRCERGCVKTHGGVEVCDGLDNDCDDQTDEAFPDLGQPCRNGTCPEGVWVCTADGTGAVCDGPAPAADDATCDGLDDDCDGATDEDALARACPLQQGVCAGSQQSCQGGAWTECDYGPDYTADRDTTCDGLDEDCDGGTDEDAVMLPVGETGAFAHDDRDNNCNGLVDEPGGVMVWAEDGVAIDAYEISLWENPDCSGTRYGAGVDDYPAGFPATGTPSDIPYACSLPGVLPSGHLSWYRARWACEAQGKRLCTAHEYRSACAGPELNSYPYGLSFTAGICNDGWTPGAQLAETGAFAACVSGAGGYDMSGNLSEWVAEASVETPGCRLTAGFQHVCEFCDGGQLCAPCDTSDNENQHKMDRAADCNPDDISWEVFPPDDARSYHGARCCWDIP